MNVIAGVLIGVVTHSILSVVIGAVLWGLIYYAYQKFSGHDKKHIEEVKIHHPERVHPERDYLFVTYFTSLSTSLLIGVIVFSIKKFI